MWYIKLETIYQKHTPYGMGDRTSELDKGS